MFATSKSQNFLAVRYNRSICSSFGRSALKCLDDPADGLTMTSVVS